MDPGSSRRNRNNMLSFSKVWWSFFEFKVFFRTFPAIYQFFFTDPVFYRPCVLQTPCLCPGSCIMFPWLLKSVPKLSPTHGRLEAGTMGHWDKYWEDSWYANCLPDNMHQATVLCIVLTPLNLKQCTVWNS